MQSELRFALFERSVNELRFALLVESVNGLRFAQLNSQEVEVLAVRRPSSRSRTVRGQRVMYYEGTPRFARFHFNPVRHGLRSLFNSPATYVRFGHQRPNPSVERTAKGLRPSSAAHLAR